MKNKYARLSDYFSNLLYKNQKIYVNLILMFKQD